MKPNIEELRKKYMDNPPEGMTSKQVLRSILFDAVICRIRQIKISHFQPCYNGNNFFLLLL